MNCFCMRYITVIGPHGIPPMSMFMVIFHKVIEALAYYSFETGIVLNHFIKQSHYIKTKGEDDYEQESINQF